MPVELRQLRYFVAVAEKLHFRRAAELLFVSQPTLSHQIATLEKALGITLLDRDRRHVALTGAGEVLLVQARQILAQVDQGVARVRWAGGLTSAGLRVGYAAHDARSVRGLLEAFRREHPEVWLEEHEMDAAAQVRALNADALDVGLAPPLQRAGLAVEPVAPQDLVVAVPAVHRLARLEEVPLLELAGERLLMAPLRSNPGYYGYVSALCKLAGVKPEIVWLDRPESFRLEALLPMVANGMGLALLTTVPPAAPPGVVLRPVRPSGPLYRLAVVWRRDDPSPLVRAFVEVTRYNQIGPDLAGHGRAGRTSPGHEAPS